MSKLIEEYGIITERVDECIVRDDAFIVPEIRDPRKIAEVIINHIKTNCVFVRREHPACEESPREMTGILVCDFRLDEIRRKCALSANNDDLIIAAMHRLADEGKLVVFDLGMRGHAMDHNDIFFASCFAEVVKSNPPDSVTKVLRFYPEKPLTKAEQNERPNAIRNISERVRKIREHRDAMFRERFGWRDLDLENKLRREDLVAETKLKSAILKIAQKSGGK